jgi:hypothetical protein
MSDLGQSSYWGLVFSSARHVYQTRYDNETRRDYAIRTRGEGLLTKTLRLKDGQGLERFYEFERIIEHEFSWGRHHFEREFHKLSTIALGELLLGNDWSTYGTAIFAKRGWKFVSRLVIGTAPRRFGKSVSMAKLIAALVAALLRHVEGLNFTEYNITVFSTGKRASSLLAQYVQKFLVELNLIDNIITNNSETIALSAGTQGSDSYLKIICMFVPSNPTT